MTIRQKRQRRQHTRLTSDQFVELVDGPGARGLCGPPYYCGFGDDRDAMREAWERHRDAFLGLFRGVGRLEDFVDRLKPWVTSCASWPGTRPWAWWEFDAPEPLPEDEDEADYLERFGLWLPGEKKQLKAQIEARIRDLTERRGHLTGAGPFMTNETAEDRRRAVGTLDREIADLRDEAAALKSKGD
jgi:hypothetical protein